MTFRGGYRVADTLHHSVTVTAVYVVAVATEILH